MGMLCHFVRFGLCLFVLIMGVAAAAEDSDEVSPWQDATGDLFAGEAAGASIWRVTTWPGQGMIIAALAKRGLWSSADGGVTWKRLGEIGKRPPDVGIGVQVIADPLEPKCLWCSGMYGFGCWRTDDGGSTFKHLGNNDHLDGIAIDFSDPQRQTLLEGLHEQPRSLHLSVDGGTTWTGIGERLPEGTSFSTLPIIVDTKTFIVNTSGWGKLSWGIWRSTDSGASWVKTSDAGPADCALVTSTGHIFWHVLWNNDHVVSRDGGATWAVLSAPVRGGLIELPGGILVGLGGGKQAQPFASCDDGVTWKAFGEEVPFRPVGIVYDTKKNALLCYRGEARGSSPQIVRWDLPASPAHVVASSVQNRITVWDGEGNAGGGGWITAGDGAFIRPQKAMVKQGTTALEYHVEKGMASEGGWNWHNWAIGQLTDITACTHLQMWLKYSGKETPSTVHVELNCGPNKTRSAAVDVMAMMPSVCDGEWHHIEIPLIDFYTAGFEPKNIYEIRLRTTAKEPITFSMFIDSIRFISHQPPK